MERPNSRPQLRKGTGSMERNNPHKGQLSYLLGGGKSRVVLVLENTLSFSSSHLGPVGGPSGLKAGIGGKGGRGKAFKTFSG